MSDNGPKILQRSGPWLVVESRSRAAGQVYYFNSQTGEKTWIKPKTFNTEAAESVEKKTAKEAGISTGKKTVEHSSENNSKMNASQTKRRREDDAGAPCPKRRSGESTNRTEKQERERRNLGSFKHTFKPPVKSANYKEAAKEAWNGARDATSPSSHSSRVSVNLRPQKSTKLTKAPSNDFSEYESRKKSPLVPSTALSPKSSAKAWLSNVPAGVINRPILLADRTTNNNQRDALSRFAKQDPNKHIQGDDTRFQEIRERLAPKLCTLETDTGRRIKRSSTGEIKTKGLVQEQSYFYQPPVTRRRSGGLAEERLRKLRNNLWAEVTGKTEQKKEPSEILPQDEPTELARRKVPPEVPEIQDANLKRDVAKTVCQTQENLTSKNVPCAAFKVDPARRGDLPPTPLEVMKIYNESLKKKNVASIEFQTHDTPTSKIVPSTATKIDPARGKSLPPTPLDVMKIYNESLRKKEVTSTVLRSQETVTNKVVNNLSSFENEVPDDNANPPAIVFEVEAMDVDEEAQLLSDIKAMRTAATWESFDTESTPVPEVVGVSADTKSAAIVVIDTNILLSHLSFVRELRDSAKLYGDHPILYTPWMVQQELDRLKNGSCKAARSARAAVTFLNDSFKRKHPRMRGQTGREASRARSAHLQELCPDDSILESCLQLKDQGFQTLLLSNDVSLCNKALVNDIKAVTKIQLTNEIRNSAETASLLYTGQSPSIEKKISAMDRLRSASQRTQPTQPEPRPQPVPIKTVAKPTSVMGDLKNVLLDTFSQVISTGMGAVYGSLWAKRVLYKPPWEVDKVFLCLAHHWFALCDENIPESVRLAVNQLRNIFRKDTSDNSVNDVIDRTMKICSRLSSKYDKIIAPLNNQIEAFRSSGSESLKLIKNDDQSDQNSISRDQSPESCRVLPYLHTLWTIVHPFCSEVKAKLENGITLDKDTLNGSKEMLNGILGLVTSINEILSVPEKNLDITNKGLKDFLELLRSITVPAGAEPLQIQHVFAFCVQPESRLLLLNGLSQLGECGTLLMNAINSTNSTNSCT